jgi:hypothetical protein
VSSEGEQKKGKDVNLKASVRVDGVDIEVSLSSRPNEVESTLGSILSAVESQADKILSMSKRFGQSAPAAAQPPPAASEDPYTRMATDLGVNADELRAARLIGFKNEKPQILAPAKFATPEKGCLALFYAFEMGLDKSPIAFEEGEEAFTMSRYTVAFAGRVLNNLKIANKINRARYDSAHEIVLAPSGVEDAREIIRAALAGAVKPRRKQARKKRKRS